MEYKVVSGDSHMDMSWLPGDLFTSSAPSHLKEQMPQVVEREGGQYWVSEGQELGPYGSLGFGFNAPRRGMRKRIDRMFDAGYYEGGGHPSTPELRMKDMQMDGVDAEVIYGMTTAGNRIKNVEALTHAYRAYNQWIADFCKTKPGRWYGLACIPVHDPQVGADELRRAGDMGLRGADMFVTPETRPIYMRDGYWDPLWRASAECQMPVSFHIGGGGIIVPEPPGEEGKDFLAEDIDQNGLGFMGARLPVEQLSGSVWLVSIIMSGVFDRFPDFQFVLGECGAGWIPFVVERMDVEFSDAMLETKFDPPLKQKPSDYWFQHGATTFQEDPTVGYMAKFIGEDNIMWGSDYPHPDGVWPDSQAVIKETIGQLEPAVLQKVIRDNAVKKYRMGQ